MVDLLESFWSGKAVMITGASSGIGYAVTEALAPYQISFGLLSRRRGPMQALAEKLRESGSSFWIKSCDVRNREEVAKAVHEFYREVGRLDVLWANSGVSGRTSLSGWSWENFENVIDTNLKGAIYTIVPALQIMVQQGHGAIVAIGSASSMRGMPQHTAYSLTKIGLHYFVDSMAVEVPQIQFSIIHPGYVDTPLNAGRKGRVWLMSAEKAAAIMIKAVAKGKKVVIFPGKMKFIYYLVRILPTSWYRQIARQAIRSGRAGGT